MPATGWAGYDTDDAEAAGYGTAAAEMGCGGDAVLSLLRSSDKGRVVGSS